RVSDRNVQAFAALQDRQDAVLAEQLLVDELDYVEIDVDRIEVEQRHAELVGSCNCDLPGVAEPVGDEVRDQQRAFAVDRLETGDKVFLRNDPVLNQAARQAGERTLNCSSGH